MDDFEIPDTGAVYTFGKTRFADNKPSHFFIKNDPIIGTACGDEHTIVLCQNGRLFSFGSNEYGQLGLGHSSTVNRPSCIKALKPVKIKLITCGRSHSIAISENNHIYTFGNNSDGQLGQSNTIDRDLPTRIEQSPLKSYDKIIQVSAGSSHSALLTDRGRLFVWGSNTEGQLGLNLEANAEKITTPTLLRETEKIKFISCGYYHTGFITESGKVYIFGENENGKLGLNIPGKYIISPTLLDMDLKFLKIFCGGHHTFLISDDNELYTCGLNVNGQLGIDDENVVFVSEPLKINKNIFDNSDIEYISCGERHTAFVTKTRKLYTCGDTKHGKLGFNVDESEKHNSQFCPKLITQFDDIEVCSAVCGGCHTIVSVQKPSIQIDLEIIPSKPPTLPPMLTKIEIPIIENNLTNHIKPISKENSIESTNEDIDNTSQLNGNHLNGDENSTKDESQEEFELLEKKCEEETNEQCDIESTENIIQNSSDCDSKSQENLTTIAVEENSSSKLTTDSESSSTCGETNSDITKSQEQISDIDNKDVEILKEDQPPKKAESKVTKFFKSFKRKRMSFDNKIANSKDSIIQDENIKENVTDDKNNIEKSKTCSIL